MLDGLDKVEGLTAEQLEAINGLAGGILNKNTELLHKLSNNKTAGDQTAAEIEALRLFKQNSDIKAAEDANNWKQADALREEAHKLELGKLSDKVSELSARESKLVIDGGINSELDAIQVNPLLKQGVEAYFKNQTQIIDGKAMVGDKSLSDAVKEWAETDAGKASCLAPNNKGGDGLGGSGGKPTSLNDLTLTQQSVLANTDPAEYQRLKGK